MLQCSPVPSSSAGCPYRGHRLLQRRPPLWMAMNEAFSSVSSSSHGKTLPSLVGEGESRKVCLVSVDWSHWAGLRGHRRRHGRGAWKEAWKRCREGRNGMWGDRNGGLWHIGDAQWSCEPSSVGKSWCFASCSTRLFPSTSPALQPGLLLLWFLIGMWAEGCMGPEENQQKFF